MGKTLQFPAPPLCGNEAQSHEMCHEVHGEGITVGTRDKQLSGQMTLTAASRKERCWGVTLHETHSLWNPGSQYPSFICDVAAPSPFMMAVTGYLTTVASSPKSMYLTFEILLREDENRTPPCRQVDRLAPLSSPKQGHLFGNICLLTVSDHS